MKILFLKKHFTQVIILIKCLQSIHEEFCVVVFLLEIACNKLKTIENLKIGFNHIIFRGRGMGRGGPMSSMPRGFNGPPGMRRGMLRGILPRGMNFR